MFAKYKSAIIIVGISLAIMLPAFILGSGGNDLIFHTLWSEQFHQQILGGNLYPRWLHDINSGCGEPVFFFYPPVSFYLNSIVQIITGNQIDSWYSLSISLLIAILAGNIFLYLWVKDITESKKYALCAVVIFTLLPYKSSYIYYSFTYPQAIASICFLPAVLFFIHKYHSTSKNLFLLGYLVTQSLIFLTNIPSTIVMSGLPVLYYIYCMSKDRCFMHIKKLILVIIASVLLSSFYLLPLYELLPYIHIGNNSSNILSGHLNYKVNFIDYTKFDINYRASLVNLILMLLSIKFFYHAIRSNISSGLRKHLIFWFSVNTVLFFLMLSTSQPIWELLSFMKHIQFPYRFSTIQAICLTFIIVIYLISRKDIPESIDRFMWPFIIIVSVLTVANATPRWSIKDEIVYFGNNNDKNLSSRVQEMNMLYRYNKTVYSDYLPIFVNQKFIGNTRPSIEKLRQYCSTQTKTISGDANIEIRKWHARDIELAVNSSDESVIQVNQLYFPNWRARNENNIEYPITPVDYYGTIQIKIPKGEHIIKLEMLPFKSEIIGKYISLSTLFILSSYLVYCLRRKNDTTNRSN